VEDEGGRRGKRKREREGEKRGYANTSAFARASILESVDEAEEQTEMCAQWEGHRRRDV
jgi:hypothetical protein